MRTIYYCLALLLSVAATHCFAQDNAYPVYDPDVPEMADIQKVIDASMDDIEDSIRVSGTFQSFATVILQNDSIADIRVSQQGSGAVSIQDLEDALSVNALNGTYKVICIFYLTESDDPAAPGNSRVVKIHAEHTNDDFAYRFEFPYSQNAKHQVVFGETAVDFEPQVMFKL